MVVIVNLHAVIPVVHELVDKRGAEENIPGAFNIFIIKNGSECFIKLLLYII